MHKGKIIFASNKKDTPEEVPFKMVEVRGIEPLSEEQSKQAATCLVCGLISLPLTPSDRLYGKPALIDLICRSVHLGKPAFML